MFSTVAYKLCHLPFQSPNDCFHTFCSAVGPTIGASTSGNYPNFVPIGSTRWATDPRHLISKSAEALLLWTIDGSPTGITFPPGVRGKKGGVVTLGQGTNNESFCFWTTSGIGLQGIMFGFLRREFGACWKGVAMKNDEIRIVDGGAEIDSCP